MSRVSCSNPRPVVTPCNYLRETAHSLSGSILGSRIIHSETFSHRCGPSCGEKCAAGSLGPHDLSNETENIPRSRFFSTVKTTDSNVKQEDHLASKPEQEDDLAARFEGEDDLASEPDEEDDLDSEPDEEDDPASNSKVEDDTALDNQPDSVKGVERAERDDYDATRRAYRRPLTPEEVQEADGIGYRVIGSAKQSDGKSWRTEPIFAVVQIGSHQFKVSAGDWIYVEKLKYADVMQKIILNKVLMLGTQSETVIGRPIVPGAAVHALVEEQALGAETIIFKKKRRKNYRRTNYHHQELTRLKIIGVEGLMEPFVAEAITA